LRRHGTAAPRRRRAPGVALVGGGPGDPRLITVRGRELLAYADVVVTDRLGPLSLLDELAPEADVVDVGKVPRGPAVSQEQINQLLVAHARAGRYVVRLKGGDPFVFGRGGEEVQACAAAGIPVEVVPGITSAVSVPALAGIPVTHRSITQHFTVAAGHLPPGHRASSVDWRALAQAGGTLVLLMAVENLPAIAAELVAGGRAATTPVALVQEGTTTRQRVTRTTLDRAGADAREAGLAPPAIIVVGEVVDALSSAEER
ncbi:MAG: uroporphyrinogen-III C-methyltransferase, partial [Actinomycetota bacterium]|nr:uroporphyrinogen-III C-methyltransferase [Actinomycetota bacterium]